MTINDLLIAVRAQLLAGLTRYGHGSAEVIAQRHVAPEGLVVGPVLYMTDVAERRYGGQSRTRRYDADAGLVLVDEHQRCETTVQFTGRAPLNDPDLAAATAEDLSAAAAMVCNSQAFVEALAAQSIGVLRVTQVRAPVFTNAAGVDEVSPSFDALFTWRRSVIEQAPAVDRVELQVEGF